MPETRPASHSVPVAKFERPLCPSCQTRMLRAHIKTTSPGLDMGLFECASCDRVQKVLVANDPMKSDTLGWLFADLRPPT
jgi:hypothetical protein